VEVLSWCNCVTKNQLIAVLWCGWSPLWGILKSRFQ
jgi:hypothetical protein